MFKPEGATVEIIDTGDNPSVHSAGVLLPQRVIVNGQDLGRISAQGIVVETDTDNVVKVTVTLMPSRVVIRSSEQQSVGDTERCTCDGCRGRVPGWYTEGMKSAAAS